MSMIFCDLFPDTYSAFDRMICLSLNCLFDGFFLLRQLCLSQLNSDEFFSFYVLIFFTKFSLC